MNFDLQTVKQELEKAKAEVRFWEDALRVLTDPRVAGLVKPTPVTGFVISQSPQQAVVAAAANIQRPYGELKRKVFDHLPRWGEHPVTTTQIVERMEAGGYVFASKTPSISVNEALVTLESEERAFMVTKQGITRFWTRTQPKAGNAAQFELEKGF
jgi:hypothetical protein